MIPQYSWGEIYSSKILHKEGSNVIIIEVNQRSSVEEGLNMIFSGGIPEMFGCNCGRIMFKQATEMFNV